MARTQGKPQVVEGEYDDGPSYGYGGSHFDEEPRGRAMVQAPSNGAPLVRAASQAITAIKVAVPRDLDRLRDRVVKEAALMAESWSYAWQVRDKSSKTGFSTISGPSIDAAMVLLRNWGNATVETSIEDETATHWIFRSTFIDYETGFAVPRLFRQRKAQSTGGKMNAEREQDIAFQIGQSKSQRNAVIKGIPAWLQSAAEGAVVAAASKRFEDLPKANAGAQAAFAKMGVTVAELVRWVGKPVEQWTALDHVRLSQARRAIIDGVTSVDSEFRAPFEASNATTPPGEEQPAPKDDGDQAGDARPGAPTTAPTQGPEPQKPRQREPGED